MKIGTVPVANRLQAIETTLDSLSQRNPTLRELKEALRLIRSVQRTMVGPRYVRERSLKRYTTSGSDPKKLNWRKWQKERELKHNGDADFYRQFGAGEMTHVQGQEYDCTCPRCVCQLSQECVDRNHAPCCSHLLEPTEQSAEKK